MRVVGIDTGTVSLDLCGLDEGRIFLDRSMPTSDALADPALIPRLLRDAGPLDLVAGPSGYGLPLTEARTLTESDIRLACLAPRGEGGGIGGLGALLRALAAVPVPVMLTPGVVHLPTVPPHRKINRVDMGTADKVCAVALAIHQESRRRGCSESDVSLVLVELGGAFTSAIAVERGQIVDGLGGSSGPVGARACGALDAEVAFLAGHVSKEMLFRGGALDVARSPQGPIEVLLDGDTVETRLAWAAYVESTVKAVASLAASLTDFRQVVLSGRMAREALRGELASRLSTIFRQQISVDLLPGLGGGAKHAAQGAALVADGLAGGAAAPLVNRLGIRDARGTALDHLHVISPDAARRRLGIE